MNEAVNYPQQDNTDDETLGEKLALVFPYRGGASTTAFTGG